MNVNNVILWPRDSERRAELPKRVKRPCDYGLEGAVVQLESQLGTIEAYNRLCAAAKSLRSVIDDGRAKAPNTNYRVKK
jgi:hypothetical protein